MLTTSDFIPKKDKVKIILTSGASCPDAVVENVLKELLSFFDNRKSIEEVMAHFKQE
jgi:4-hydroxy-3-methylbut-2-enyl diphosphate reductase